MDATTDALIEQLAVVTHENILLRLLFSQQIVARQVATQERHALEQQMSALRAQHRQLTADMLRYLRREERLR